MIIDKKYTEVAKAGLSDTQQAKIHVSAKMYELLSSNIYKHKIPSIIRELLCNAKDAHIEVKTNKPISVSTPSTFAPMYTIRDFGTGLSHEDTLNLYLTFGLSTKQESNDFIGAMGIGSKSPLSYTDSFIVNSYKDNVMRSYVVFTEDGIPSISFLGMVNTEEENGLEIQISVNNKDMSAFSHETKKFCKHFQYPVEIDGKLAKEADYEKTKYGFSLWDDSGSYYPSFFINMGGVLYKIDTSELPGVGSNTNTNKSVVYDVPIGGISVTTSREDISYDKKTNEYLNNLLKNYYDDLASYYKSQMGSFNKLSDILSYIYSAGFSYQMRKKLVSKIIFNGKSVKEWENCFSDFSRNLKGVKTHMVGGARKSFSNDYLNIGIFRGRNKLIFCINDEKRGNMAAFLRKFSNNTSDILLYISKEAFEISSKDDVEFLMQHCKYSISYLSDVLEEEAKLRVNDPSKFIAKKQYYKSSGIFSFSKRYMKELQGISTEDEGYYVDMVRNDIYVDNSYIDTDVLYEILTFCDINDDIYFIRKTNKIKRSTLALKKLDMKILEGFFKEKFGKDYKEKLVILREYNHQNHYYNRSINPNLKGGFFDKLRKCISYCKFSRENRLSYGLKNFLLKFNLPSHSVLSYEDIIVEIKRAYPLYKSGCLDTNSVYTKDFEWYVNDKQERLKKQTSKLTPVKNNSKLVKISQG